MNILVCMFDVNPKLLRKLKEEFDLIVEADPTERKVGIPEAVVKRVFRVSLCMDGYPYISPF